MSDVTTAWIRELERRFGVRAEFSQCLLPLLGPLARECDDDASVRESILHAVAAAYRAMLPAQSPADRAAELQLLCGQFMTELRKMDESLKVLSVVLQRVRQQMVRSASPDALH
jgi:hypothetical protein